jgi:hypothetical protein
MKMRIMAILAAFAAASATYAAVEGSDNASTYGGTWNNGSGANAAFSAWSLSSGNGTGAAGTFIGDPASGGISGMSATSFGMFANTNNSGAVVDAGRSFSGALSVGQTFSFDWGINFDSGSSGAKGFHITSGGPNGTQLISVNNGGNSDITLNSNNIGFGYGVNVMTWSFTLLDASTVQVQANDRDGVGSYNQNITVASAPDSFRLYAFQMQPGDNAQPYFNNFQIVPEPSTMVMALMGALGLVAARRRLQK